MHWIAQSGIIVSLARNSGSFHQYSALWAIEHSGMSCSCQAGYCASSQAGRHQAQAVSDELVLNAPGAVAAPAQLPFPVCYWNFIDYGYQQYLSTMKIYLLLRFDSGMAAYYFPVFLSFVFFPTPALVKLLSFVISILTIA